MTTKHLRRRLLSEDTNSKTVKGQKLGFLTGILYLAPGSLSGVNLCPLAEAAGCLNPCLYGAGRAAFTPSIPIARINKTKYYLENKAAFFHNLVMDIELLIAHAEKKGLIPLVRLNGTSDIRWENEYFDHEFMNGKIRSVNIFQVFPEVQFYDYTKISNRKNIPKNYDLTFSYSGRAAFKPFLDQAMAAGMRIAAVFHDKNNIPDKFMGRKVLPGDNSDIRHTEKKNSIVALYAKGPAKKDFSGFVVDNRPVIYLKAA